MPICYMDKTFCKFHSRCKAGAYCNRSLTDQLRADAAGFGLPISQFVSEPSCFDEKDKDDDARIQTEE